MLNISTNCHPALIYWNATLRVTTATCVKSANWNPASGKLTVDDVLDTDSAPLGTPPVTVLAGKKSSTCAGTRNCPALAGTRQLK